MTTMAQAWLLTALGLVACLVPCAVTCLRGAAIDRLVGLEMTSVVCPLLLMALAQASADPSLYDLALALALLTFGGGLVFARFLERWT